MARSDPMDAAGFRRIMGCFATGVTVVTTAADGNLHGITVNSLTSVSLDPPLLLVCIDRGAEAHRQIDAGVRFAVNFLGAGQEDLSRIFAAKGEPEHGHLRGVPFRMGTHGTPLLEGCLAHLECAVVDRYPGGDHTIFIASVLGGELRRDDAPLLFYRGQYRRMAT